MNLLTDNLIEAAEFKGQDYTNAQLNFKEIREVKLLVITPP